jgi:hypothetical protein
MEHDASSALTVQSAHESAEPLARAGLGPDRGPGEDVLRRPMREQHEG